MEIRQICYKCLQYSWHTDVHHPPEQFYLFGRISRFMAVWQFYLSNGAHSTCRR